MSKVDIKGKIRNFATTTPLQWSSDSKVLSSLTSLVSSLPTHKTGFVEIEINLEIKLSYINGVNEYQWGLIRKIEELKEQDWTFKEIAVYLRSKGYTSARGKPLSPPLVERTYKKFLKKIDNESIKHVSIRLIES